MSNKNREETGNEEDRTTRSPIQKKENNRQSVDEGEVKKKSLRRLQAFSEGYQGVRSIYLEFSKFRLSLKVPG